MHKLETNPILKERHGYDTGYFNRYDLLCVLHKHVREKERLLVNQKVVRVDTYEDKVVVQTSTGDVFEAQCIVGADGVRSTVRKEMWRNAEAAGAVPEEDKKGQSKPVADSRQCAHFYLAEIICDWATCYGVSKYGASLPRGQVGSVAGEGYNAGWMVGKDGRCLYVYPVSHSLAVDLSSIS